MSLKIFHIFFIVLAIALSALCATWAFVNQVEASFVIGCATVAFALIVYGVWFVRKSRQIIT